MNFANFPRTPFLQDNSGGYLCHKKNNIHSKKTMLLEKITKLLFWVNLLSSFCIDWRFLVSFVCFGFIFICFFCLWENCFLNVSYLNYFDVTLTVIQDSFLGQIAWYLETRFCLQYLPYQIFFNWIWKHHSCKQNSALLAIYVPISLIPRHIIQIKYFDVSSFINKYCCKSSEAATRGGL